MTPLTESQAYQAWVHSQLEPEYKLFVGQRPPKHPKTWQLKGADRQHLTEQEIEERENEYLKRFGL